MANGVRHQLGKFDDPAKASEAYLAAKSVLHPFAFITKTTSRQ